jgi:rare lipoprotein A
VEITDRGPAKRLLNEGRKIDLSRAAFAKLADPDLGLIAVTVRKR